MTSFDHPDQSRGERLAIAIEAGISGVQDADCALVAAFEGHPTLADVASARVWVAEEYERRHAAATEHELQRFTNPRPSSWGPPPEDYWTRIYSWATDARDSTLEVLDRVEKVIRLRDPFADSPKSSPG